MITELFFLFIFNAIIKRESVIFVYIICNFASLDTFL